jgi:alcohol dehydrogenase, propanol-preferring
MKAMLLSRWKSAEARPLTAADLATPEPAPNEVRVRVSACGVCRTDIHVIEGELPLARMPIVPGHEIVGTIDLLGSDVARIDPSLSPSLSIGQRVGIAWLRATCGTCEFCRAGSTNLCPNARFTGYHEHGGYAEYALVPAEYAYPIPSVFSDDEAAPLLCAGIIGYRALRLSEVRPGERLGLYGFGASAHIVIQLARARGCEVYVCSLRAEHRDLARELGAAWVGGADELPPRELHASILFAPAGELVPPALRALRAGGTLACAGIHMSPIPEIDYDRELFRERTLRSVTANTRQDGLDLLREAAAIPIRPRTQAFALQDANEALARLKQGRIRGAAVLHPG